MFELSKREELLSIISDFHKDARGFRPNLARFTDFTEDQLLAEVEYLAGEVQEELERQEVANLANVRAVQTTVAINILSGAGNTREGIRWMLDANEEEFNHPQDVEGYVWSLGILDTVYGRHFLRIAQDIITEKNTEKAEEDCYNAYENHVLNYYCGNTFANL